MRRQFLLCLASALLALQWGGAHAQPCPTDGPLEVLQPPLLDEEQTGVRFIGQDAEMGVRIIIPHQYDTVHFSFDGAMSDAATFDSESNDTSLYWSHNETEIACNTVYEAVVPWDLFRTSLGGMMETRMSTFVTYSTEIVIDTTQNLTIYPETLLSMDEQEKTDMELLQSANWPQHRIRTVQTRIPFEVTFQLEITLEGNTTVRINTTNDTDPLRVEAAIVDSSVVHVNPNAVSPEPLATADLEFVTVLPLPHRLDNATIFTDEADLATDLNITELVHKRNCTHTQKFCIQYWLVKIFPQKCNLNGGFVANMTGSCHDDESNCFDPVKNYTLVVMNIRSDSFCGHTQTVSIQGSLGLSATACNGLLQGVVTVWNTDGGAINSTSIVQVRASPTLDLTSDNYTTVYDFAVTELGYTANLTQPHQVDFSFLWQGATLRCDVVATVEVVVQVEFQATRPLLLSFGSSKGAQLQQDNSDNVVRVSSFARVSAAGDETGLTGGENNPTGVANNSAFSGTLTYVIIGLLVALMVVVALVTCVYLKHLKQKTGKAAPSASSAATTGTRTNSSVSVSVEVESQELASVAPLE